jgi:mannose-6-phosphate isomerase-like protein (cupin superfamily)
MRLLVIILFVSGLLSGRSQTVINTDSIGKNSKLETVYYKALFSDSLISSFCIVIKNEVKPHKHLHHSEHVLILEGEGWMTLEGKSFSVKRDDLVFIPKGAVHSVKTRGPLALKVLSIQAPLFNGSDRVFVEEK